MTQDVQPLTWSRRTNLEEHQQFFGKINEIIDNLAPTVDEAEAAIAQATAAIASANDAIATANAASAAASAAAAQAQTAASTVAGYDTRLTAAEGDIDALQAADQTISGNVAALGTRMTAAESKNSQQDSAIATLQTADTNNVKITGTHKIGDYAVLLTGNQSKSGNMTFYDLVRLENEAQYLTQLLLINKAIEKTDRAERQETSIYFQGKNNENLASIIYAKYPNGEKHLIARLFDDTGGYHDTDIAVWSGDI